MTSEDFVGWLTCKMSEIGWSNSELARRAGVVPSTISMIVSRKNQPTWELCSGIAKAFDLPPEDVFRRAGLLPPVAPPGDVTYITQTTRALPADQIKMVREFVEFLYKKAHEHR